jgi:hypothetical protein
MIGDAPEESVFSIIESYQTYEAVI